MPASKILMGQNLYGYDWTLPFVQGTIAKRSALNKLLLLAAANNVPFNMTLEHKLLFYNYTDAKESSMKSGLKMHARSRQNST